ncbi:MAG: ABC transporter permease, partial [Dehalococcoidia bacterium]|nr:ABC transporter permease [Dehalococcoidia bacterium]
MLRLIAVRIGWSIPVLFFVSVISFVLLRLAPGDPARLQAGVDASQEQVDAIRKDLRLDDPWPVQYVSWAGRVIRGDL